MEISYDFEIMEIFFLWLQDDLILIFPISDYRVIGMETW